MSFLQEHEAKLNKSLEKNKEKAFQEESSTSKEETKKSIGRGCGREHFDRHDK